jgi:beta-galactosidase
MHKSKLTVTEKGVEIKWSAPYMTLKTSIEAGEDCIRVSMQCRNLIWGMPRYGFAMKAKAENAVKFFGKGPHENYCDRAAGANEGQYSGTVQDFQHEYLKPQENGNHTETRWLSVGGEEGILFEGAGKTFEFSCHDYSVETLEQAKHLHELAHEDDGVYIYIDGQQRGVGGDVPSLAVVKKPYKINPCKKHTLEFVIRPAGK